MASIAWLGLGASRRPTLRHARRHAQAWDLARIPYERREVDMTEVLV